MKFILDIINSNSLKEELKKVPFNLKDYELEWKFKSDNNPDSVSQYLWFTVLNHLRKAFTQTNNPLVYEESTVLFYENNVREIRTTSSTDGTSKSIFQTKEKDFF